MQDRVGEDSRDVGGLWPGAQRPAHGQICALRRGRSSIRVLRSCGRCPPRGMGGDDGRVCDDAYAPMIAECWGRA